MEFTNSFSVKGPVTEVWQFMLNVNEVAPCVPGAQITEVVDERHYKGTVKVKLGAVQMTYRGELEMEPDEERRTITLRAKGTEQRGSGGASGTVTTTLAEGEDGGTHVEIVSRIDVTGRVAQFGRGIMQDVSNKLIKEFARCLEQKIQTSGTDSAMDVAQTAEASPPPSTHTAPTSADSPNAAAASSGEAAGKDSGPTVSPPPPTSRQAAQSPPPSAELSMQGLIWTVIRGRTAGLLRRIAVLIEPK